MGAITAVLPGPGSPKPSSVRSPGMTVGQAGSERRSGQMACELLHEHQEVEELLAELER
jgi:hypothetical protein